MISAKRAWPHSHAPKSGTQNPSAAPFLLHPFFRQSKRKRGSASIIHTSICKAKSDQYISSWSLGRLIMYAKISPFRYLIRRNSISYNACHKILRFSFSVRAPHKLHPMIPKKPFGYAFAIIPRKLQKCKPNIETARQNSYNNLKTDKTAKRKRGFYGKLHF